MPDNALNPALKEASKASSNAGAALDHAERSFALPAPNKNRAANRRSSCPTTA